MSEDPTSSLAALRVAVVDYGSGNLRSVAKALERAGVAPEVTGDPAAVRAADAVVLPGVGAFADAMASLRAKGLDAAVLASIEAGRPYLGLCLGLQLLFEESSEHGRTRGFGILPGHVDRFPKSDESGRALRVPHIGWNDVVFRGRHPVLDAVPERDFFYFVHGYRAVPADAPHVVGVTDYGGVFAAAVATEKIFAVQFHPEKSQTAGGRLLAGFARWIAEAC